MRLYRWAVPMMAALLAALVASGCGGAPTAPQDDNPKVNLDTAFELGVGKTASLLPEPLSVTFIGVEEDSRCPTGVQCFWAGQALVTIKVSPTGGGPGTVTLILDGGNAGKDTGSFGKFNVQVTALEPVPVADAATNKNEYFATFVITKK